MEEGPEREPLTMAEDSLYGHIGRYLEKHEFPPTIRELATWAGLSVTETFRCVQKLREKGYITKGPTRTMRIIP